ncbi:MAG: efflux RND transporter periplasmic adaptor subunit [Acidobacteriota bacterium]|nr:efflux RND transporter periplasmic adaptor subunit [Acidobacteriota bacterium]
MLKSLVALALISGLACDRKNSADTAKTPAPSTSAQADEQENEVSLKDIRGVRFTEVAEAQQEGAWFPAEAIGDESAQSLLTSPVKGIIAGIQMTPGVKVKAGAPLLVIQSPELARFKSDWLTAKANRLRAESNLAREQRLFEGKAGSQRELELARSEAATAQADEEAARLALQARGVSPEAAGATFTVRAPKTGEVTAYKVQMGQGVDAGQELGGFQSALASLIKLELPLPAPEDWKPGAATEARKSDGRKWKATLEGTPMTLSQDTRRLTYRLRLVGSPLPLPGTPLEVRVPLTRAIVLPQAALQQIEGSWGVFILQEDRAKFRSVRRGVELGSDVMVLDGVKPGERVATEGAYLLKSLLLKQKSGGEDHEN